MKFRRLCIKRYSDKTVKASFTIEAAYIMPIILFTIIALIYITIYLHNITLFRSSINDAMLKAKAAFMNERDPYSGEINYASVADKKLVDIFFHDNAPKEQYLAEFFCSSDIPYVYAHTENWAISVDVFSVTINADMKMDISLPVMFRWLDEKLSCTKLSYGFSLIGREEKLRMYSVLKETALKIKGVEGFLDKVKTALSKFSE